jgi:hypothetical protein
MWGKPMREREFFLFLQFLEITYQQNDPGKTPMWGKPMREREFFLFLQFLEITYQQK